MSVATCVIQTVISSKSDKRNSDGRWRSYEGKLLTPVRNNVTPASVARYTSSAGDKMFKASFSYGIEGTPVTVT